ncbi:hypothetical protein E5E91_09285 [Deinococcus radiodurans R1 = ATCC 13939 = DSM 20539]|uniref:Uncharacterized protein n=1 Tax=Deinococcus radiodurans (strain ATCC 13939 / DSM 20539 / JCM 16871 / CCUG 27074 / LMG 4051 / NBRC 15346 / NCIMB 9279 / VKM B-1422 / R1) TaxID=243230 RepID=Q9RTG3_DEIRA|nr:hypothetical protein DR_1801 [Deinococcus radiodurans R1 = ATCC 13939 = DSM 20539]QEM71218.1 hypothetical protein DXG80_05200 [Deinococcus radiodurans]UDL00870.1 hypothetical protein E5E91_09285 [Deinococcus radiodurans R1 = ATCC 13939 = DSM 20539]
MRKKPPEMCCPAACSHPQHSEGKVAVLGAGLGVRVVIALVTRVALGVVIVVMVTHAVWSTVAATIPVLAGAAVPVRAVTTGAARTAESERILAQAPLHLGGAVTGQVARLHALVDGGAPGSGGGGLEPVHADAELRGELLQEHVGVVGAAALRSRRALAVLALAFLGLGEARLVEVLALLTLLVRLLLGLTGLDWLHALGLRGEGEADAEGQRGPGDQGKTVFHAVTLLEVEAGDRPRP